MANTKDIRAKISTTIKTQQTTKAMKVVSAAKLRKAQNAIVNARPYAQRIASVIRKIAISQKVEHPLLEKPTVDGKILLVILTSDRGLCGGFNSNIIKYARAFYAEKKAAGREMDLIFIGRKAADFFRKQLQIEGKKTILNLSKEINYDMAAKVSEELLEAYVNGEYTEIRLIYNEFKSAISQNVIDEKLLPLDVETKEDITNSLSNDFTFEPAAEEIIDELLKKHFTVQVYRCMQESIASEHGARMNAMENATSNAGEMIRSLTLTYNKIRQAAITTELIEITSGAEALQN